MPSGTPHRQNGKMSSVPAVRPAAVLPFFGLAHVGRDWVRAK